MQKYVAARSKLVFKIPENITDAEAATQGTALVASVSPPLSPSTPPSDDNSSL
jgi:hypothetical protein